MIFQPSKKIFIDYNDYLQIFVKLSSIFLRPESRWLEDYEIEYLTWCLKAHENGIQIASRKFVPWMLENSPYKDRQVLYNYKSKLTVKKWIIKSEHGISFPKALSDFVECIKRGDKALECRFLMDYVPDKDISLMNATPVELHPLTEARVSKIMRKKRKLLKQERKEKLDKGVQELQRKRDLQILNLEEE